MGCVLWRCDSSVMCPNESVCDKVLCVWFLRHDCNKCLYRDVCVACQRLGCKNSEVKQNVDESSI